MTTEYIKMERKYSHFKKRYKERLSLDISINDIDKIVHDIVNKKIDLAFPLDEKVDIYMYKYSELRNTTPIFCYIFFDKNQRIPLTVYNGFQFGNKIRNMK